MRFTVDANVLFTFFWEDSVFSSICQKQVLGIFSPEFALGELRKHSLEIMKKARLSTEEFTDRKKKLALRVTFIPLEKYAIFLKQAASKIKKGLSNEEYVKLMKDIDFLALALRLHCPLWSNDKMLMKQGSILVLNTQEIIELVSADSGF